MIKFGTDGWRGLIARDFTFENIRLVALATAQYVKKNFNKKEHLVVIGYDTRFLSKEFAEETAMVLADEGIKSYLSEGFSSTPQVSFNTKHLNADIGVVITASHNPGIYNGYKLKADFGGPGTPEQVNALEAELKLIWDNRPLIKLKDFQYYIDKGMIALYDAKKDYIEHISKVIDLDAIRKAGLKIIYDPMYGAGMNTLKEILPDAEHLHDDFNPSFGEIDHPEPIDDYLPQLISKVKAGNYDLGIATDGDADRVGLIDSDGNFVDSHRLFMILLKYLNEIKGAHGSVVKTVSLTSMVNAYCADKGLELHETPVGFKHTAKIMSEEDVMIGGEESGGLGTYLHIPERDGIFNALMVLEVMVKRDMSLKQLCDELDEQFGTHRYRRRDVKVTPETKEQIMNAAGKKPTKLGKYEVKEIITKDGYKFMVDKGWLLIRASGTEPLIRFYAEAENLDKVNELLDAGLTLK